MQPPTWVLAGLLLTACAGERDHFYTLSTVPEGGRPTLVTPVKNVLLKVTIPPLVDRAEIVLFTSNNGILVLDHERWAVALSEQVTQTLARDLEARRGDLLVGDRSFDSDGVPPVKINVELLRMTASRDGGVSLDARWHIVDSANQVDHIGSQRFDLPADGGGYAGVARAYSTVLGQLADALSSGLTTH